MQNTASGEGVARKRQGSVPPNGIRFRMGFKSKCWAEKPGRIPDVRSEPTRVAKERFRARAGYAQ